MHDGIIWSSTMEGIWYEWTDSLKRMNKPNKKKKISERKTMRNRSKVIWNDNKTKTKRRKWWITTIQTITNSDERQKKNKLEHKIWFCFIICLNFNNLRLNWMCHIFAYHHHSRGSYGNTSFHFKNARFWSKNCDDEN